jgi:hypothetical protein
MTSTRHRANDTFTCSSGSYDEDAERGACEVTITVAAGERISRHRDLHRQLTGVRL